VRSKAALNRFLVVFSQESPFVAGPSIPTSVQFEYLFVYILNTFASEHSVYSLSYLFNMTWGILESKGSLEHVPGTAQLEDLLPESTAHLKKGSGKDIDIVLIPQPSSDLNDPLNWPLWQRDLILLLYCFCTNICVGG
jgi:hypothetical protein